MKYLIMLKTIILSENFVYYPLIITLIPNNSNFGS